MCQHLFRNMWPFCLSQVFALVNRFTTDGCSAVRSAAISRQTSRKCFLCLLVEVGTAMSCTAVPRGADLGMYFQSGLVPMYMNIGVQVGGTYRKDARRCAYVHALCMYACTCCACLCIVVRSNAGMLGAYVYAA